jgi:hypothetical protein
MAAMEVTVCSSNCGSRCLGIHPERPSCMHTDCEMCFGKSGKRRVGERCHCATTKRVSRTLAWLSMGTSPPGFWFQG